MSDEQRDTPPRAASRGAGEDDENPYRDVDLSAYPDWWRKNIRTFQDFGMRPYRPPRFADGGVVPEVITRLETEFGVEIRLRAIDPRVGEDWGVYVDGRRVAEIGRERVGDGYTEYQLTAEGFEALIEDGVES